MAKGVLLPSPFGYRVANSGFTGPGAGYKLRIRDGGTTDLSSVYTDVDLSSAGSNPVIANADGEWANDGNTQGGIYVDDGTYDIALLTDADVVLAEVTDVRVRVPYRQLSFSVTGKPAAGAILTLEAGFAFSLLEDMAGSRVRVGTAPSDGAHVVTVEKNGSSVNTISTATGQNDGAVAGSNSETAFAIGDTLTVVMPDPQDSTAADICVSLKVRED